MPAGRVHAQASLVSALPTGVLVYVYTGRADLAALSALGTIAGIPLSPDLDVDHKTYSEYIIDQYLGKIAGYVWYLVWLPYAKAIPHRHFLSHFPLLGTAIRLAYVWLWLLPFGLGLPLSEPALWFYVGIAVSDLIHWAMDNLY